MSKLSSLNLPGIITSGRQAPTPFPKLSALSHFRKILGETEIVLTLSKPHMNWFINAIIFISRVSQETSRAEGVAPHYFL